MTSNYYYVYMTSATYNRMCNRMAALSIALGISIMTLVYLYSDYEKFKKNNAKIDKAVDYDFFNFKDLSKRVDSMYTKTNTKKD